MVQEDFYFLSADQKTQIHGVRFMSDDKKWDKVLQITHGMQEYIMRYAEFAEYLTGRGYLVVGHDHLGHGDSVTDSRELGFFTEKNPSDTLVADIHQVRQMTQKENEGKPYFILGHSMGSYMLRKYITLHAENLSGVVIVGTGSVPDASMKLGMVICKTLAALFGWHHRSNFVRWLSFIGPYQQYDVEAKVLENNWLTKDLKIAEAYYKNEKCNYRFTVNGYFGLMETVYYDNQKENIGKIPKNLPIALASGDKDPVGDMGEGVKRVFKQYQDAGILDVTCRLYENDRHELLNETDRADVYQYLADWLDKRANKL